MSALPVAHWDRQWACLSEPVLEKNVEKDAWSCTHRTTCASMHAHAPKNAHTLTHAHTHIRTPGKFRGVCDKFGLPGTTFGKLPVPRRPVSNVFGLTLGKKARPGAQRPAVCVTACTIYKDNKCLYPCLKFLPWQGASLVIWMFLLSISCF